MAGVELSVAADEAGINMGGNVNQAAGGCLCQVPSDYKPC